MSQGPKYRRKRVLPNVKASPQPASDDPLPDQSLKYRLQKNRVAFVTSLRLETPLDSFRKPEIDARVNAALEKLASRKNKKAASHSPKADAAKTNHDEIRLPRNSS